MSSFDSNGDGMPDDGCVRYLLSDHLGSTVEVLDSSANTLSETKYWPYGATRSGGVSETDKLYTGQQAEAGDSALGLYNYKARFYSTTLGRFVSADPVVLKGETPGRSLNRYAYAANNPLAFVDPSGLFFLVVCGWKQACQWGGIDSFQRHIRAYWEIEHGKTSREQDFLWFLLKVTWDKIDDYERIRSFDVAFHDASPFSENYDERSAVYDLAWRVDHLEGFSGKPLTFAYGHSFGGLVLHDFIAGTFTGHFLWRPQFRGMLLNASPAHWAAAARGIKLFDRSFGGFQFPSWVNVMTRAGASCTSHQRC